MGDNHVRAFTPERVLDGDTIYASAVDLDYHVGIHGITYRIARVNAPEMGTMTGPTRAAANAAKTYTEQWLIEHAAHGGLFAESTQTDDWRRYLAEIECGLGHNLSDDLLSSGHAVLYHR
jgi:endonuclease YncB( thermonuclease family)